MLSSKNISVNIRLRNANDVNSIWKIKGGAIFQKTGKDSQLVYDCYQNVFLEENNDEIYKVSIQDAILQAWQGTNCTIFAYGQTGTGKTHTMMGTELESGVIQHSLTDIFELSSVEAKKHRTVVEVAYIEIYNESITDLITPNNKVKIFGSGDNTIISNLSKIRVRSKPDVLEIIRDCETKRRYGVTEYNNRSSRSHTIFQLHLTRNARTTLVNMIDLAGSERASSNYERRKEGAYINRSLLALGSVISALVKNEHVNYRDSKLTRLLQSSLTGRCSVISLCMISMAQDCLLESTTTLKFAARLSQVELKQRSERIVIESPRNSCVMCHNCASRENELKIQVADLGEDSAEKPKKTTNAVDKDQSDDLNNDILSSISNMQNISENGRSGSKDHFDAISTGELRRFDESFNLKTNTLKDVKIHEQGDEPFSRVVLKEEGKPHLQVNESDFKDQPEDSDITNKARVISESINFNANFCKENDNVCEVSTDRENASSDQVTESEICNLVSKVEISQPNLTTSVESFASDLNSISDDQEVLSSKNTTDANKETNSKTHSCLGCHCCSQTNPQEATNKSCSSKHTMQSIDFNEIAKGERFIADIKQAESLKSENAYLLAENKLLADRIKNLEETVANLMAQNPSKRINDLYILEKNMFNLQLEMLKRRIN